MLASVASGSTMYERAGGEKFFETLTTHFYAAVADDPILRPLYPEDPAAFEAARRHLEMFLIQHWGGPDAYRSERGEARLRGRHHLFAIGPAQRDAWLRHMRAALDELDLDETLDAQLWDYLVMAAHSLVNRPAGRSGGPDLGLSPA
jgi:hemoglobin